MSGSNEYISDSSDYVSSVVTDNTPFPSLTKSEKSKLNDILHKGKVSTYEHIEPDGYVVEPKTNNNTEVKNSCCCLC